jgi:hypothetical protein
LVLFATAIALCKGEEDMVVMSQCTGNKVTGLHVGASNVQRYFPKNVATIELQLDHLRIECGLAPRFWDGEPEIHDPRLCLWLESKQSQRKESRSPMPLAMIQLDEHSFTLGPVGSIADQTPQPKAVPQARMAPQAKTALQTKTVRSSTALVLVAHRETSREPAMAH